MEDKLLFSYSAKDVAFYLLLENIDTFLEGKKVYVCVCVMCVYLNKEESLNGVICQPGPG